jgi:Zn-dependent protease
MMGGVLDLTPSRHPVCPRCATELPPSALACAACSALVHRGELERLSREANVADAAGDANVGRALWQKALELVPPSSEQYRLIRERLAALPPEPSLAVATPPGAHSGWMRWGGAAGAGGLLILSKLKFLLLGLTKLKTLLSMFAFIGVYWTIHGWPLAVGIAASIYIHEMGHVSMLRRLGIGADAPIFIPGIGAMVMLREHVTDPVVDAKIGLAGPVWGLGAGIAAWLVYEATGLPLWRAIAELTGFLNLFNLIPIWQLDGSRGFHALSRRQRWMIVGTMAAAVALTGVRVLWIAIAVAIFRALQKEDGPGHTPALVTYAGLVLALSWLARAVG